MALKLAGEEIGIQEKIETLKYAPGILDTGDLEAATKTITATSRPAIGSADYSQALTLPAPSDNRLTVHQVACRLAVTMDSMTAGHLYCSVRVDIDDTDHELFSEDWDATGEKLDCMGTRSNNKADIFNLLKDGSAHTFYFMFWVDSGNAVISQVQLWEAVGSKETTNLTYPNTKILTLNHKGLVTPGTVINRVGTGTPQVGVFLSDDDWISYSRVAWVQGDGTRLDFSGSVLIESIMRVSVRGTVATDLNYIAGFIFAIRSEQ